VKQEQNIILVLKSINTRRLKGAEEAEEGGREKFFLFIGTGGHGTNPMAQIPNLS
jgi:hypothetical protein